VLHEADINTAACEVDNLCVAYRAGGRRLVAVRHLDLHVRRGETLAIVGETGSGKSTTVLAIGGLLPRNGTVEEGRVRVGSHDMRALSLRDLRSVRGREIGYVPQLPMAAFNPTARVGPQVGEPLRIHHGLRYREARPKVLEALHDMGLRDVARVADSYPHELSGGMLQRAMIAMATICDPLLLIADEPTSALDAHLRRQIIDVLRRIQEVRQLAILFVTHDLGVVETVADRVLVMYGGRAVETGPTSDVLSQPRHPYTRALLESRITLETAPKTKLKWIRGHPLTAREVDGEQGCPFRPRCERAVVACAAEFPGVREEANHSWACWNEVV
jgi:oligopeptide/dipeptide ABC transporter ATP-binding protein